MKRSRTLLLIIVAFLNVSFFFDGTGRQKYPEGSLSPAGWPPGEMEKFAGLNRLSDRPHPLAEGQKAMIVGTTGALAIRAGLEALRQGGTAADAAITTGLAQVCLAAGSWVSYAGFVTMVYYEASTSKSYAMNAAYNTVLAEDDPLSIPPTGSPSGRSALVPGFMAGMQAAHQRFGKIPFDRLFEPAIHFAEEGFIINPMLAGFLNQKKDVLSRLPETKKIFTKENGEFFKEGDLFKQPQLAAALRKIASRGAEEMYRGEWADHFVSAVRREGGKISRKDLENYRVTWSDPISTTYRGSRVVTIGPPNAGGTEVLQALNLTELALPSTFGHFTSSPQSLFRLTQACRASRLLPLLSPGLARRYFPGADFSPSSRITKENAGRVWELVQKPDWKALNERAFEDIKNAAGKKEVEKSGHSDALAVVDEYGNVAVLLLTINTSRWGSTGLFVDGISIPDSACFQQREIAKAGPGARLPDISNPLIVFKDGKVFLASNTVGSALTEIALQNLVNILDFGMDPKASVDTVTFLRAIWSSGDFLKQALAEGEFSRDIVAGLEALGQEVKIVPPAEQNGGRSWWVGIRRNPKTGVLEGGGTGAYNGCALGY